MTSYDYIVVGAGSAGAVVAGRLSENPDLRVLLIEAGGSHRHPNVQIPAAFPKQFKSKVDWEYYTEPEPHLDGRSLLYQRGKMLGGCSSMNAMIYIRGNRHDYDVWAKDGATGWSYDEVLPLFKRTENNSRGQNDYHGVDGPQHVQDLRSPRELTHAMIDAMVETGMPRNTDFNGEEQEGVGFNQVCQNRGRRWTTADAFLMPARRRPNLTIQRDTQVLRVRFAGDRAVGVETENVGFVRAEREVILSGGALNTPQLLMLSGVGPADHLAENGITAMVDNPHVGAHLMEHPFYMVNYETTAPGTLFGAGSLKHLADYYARRRGPLTSNVAELSAFFRTGSHELPDMQIIGAPGYFFDNGFATQRPAGLYVRDVDDRADQRGLGSVAQQQPHRQGRGELEHLRRAGGPGLHGRGDRAGPRDRGRPVLAQHRRPGDPPGRRRPDPARDRAQAAGRNPAYVPRGLHRAHRSRGRRCGRPGAAGPRCARSAGRRRVGVPVHTAGQHPRPGDDGRRESRRPDPRNPVTGQHSIRRPR